MSTVIDKNYLLLSEPGDTPIKAWVKGVPVEEGAILQLRDIARLPFIYSHVAVMPDVHVGRGATIGSVVATQGAIIPAAVGVDIGCGMAAHRTSLTANDLPDNLSELRSLIELAVPHGRTDNGGVNDRGAWGTEVAHSDGDTDIRLEANQLAFELGKLVDKHPKLNRAASRAWNHCGTLGTGNHFVEVCLDESDRVWVMLHSGSRGIGNAVGSYFIEKAKGEMVKQGISLPDHDLSYLKEGSELYEDYTTAVIWAQRFAKLNRSIMMRASLSALSLFMKRPLDTDLEAVNCHHNYVSIETHYGDKVIVTRKGAVNAEEGTLGIIPGSMGAKSFIVRGKGNPESFCSCSHGAGRVMSRTAARKTFTMEDHLRDTAGIECRKDNEVLDETPKAYKDIDAVMKAQEDLVEIVHTLRQVVCVKG